MCFDKSITLAVFSVCAIFFSTSTVDALVSPEVTCCTEHGGTYQIVNGSDGQYGICSKDETNTEAFLFMNQNCPPPATYVVYAYNNCDATVEADFTLDSSSGTTSSVSVDQGGCAYVGGTNQDGIEFTSAGSFVSGGDDSCKNIGSSNNDDCDLLGMADNACVIPLC